jgi:hypothetical protein
MNSIAAATRADQLQPGDVVVVLDEVCPIVNIWWTGSAVLLDLWAEGNSYPFEPGEHLVHLGRLCFACGHLHDPDSDGDCADATCLPLCTADHKEVTS